MGLLLGLSAPNTPVPASNQEVTIGSGWTLRWDFEGTTIGQSAEKVSGGFLHGAGESYFDNQHLRSGTTRNLRCHVDAGTEGAISDWGFRAYFDEELALIGSSEDGKVRTGETLYVRLYMYVPDDWSWSCEEPALCGQGIKFFRTLCEGLNGWNGGKSEGYFDNLILPATGGHRMTLDSEISGSAHSDSTDYGLTFSQTNYDTSDPLSIGTLNRHALPPVISRNSWHRYEFVVKNDYVQNRNATYRFFVDGDLMFEDLVCHTARHDFSRYTQFLLFTHWNGGAPRTQDLWVSNVEFTTQTPSQFDNSGTHRIIGEK